MGEGESGHERVSSGCGHKIKWMLYVAEATRGSEHIEVLKSNHSQGSEHRQSREMEEHWPGQESGIQGTLRDRCGIDQSMSTPHWSSKCRSPLDDNKFPFNRIYLKFLFLFLAATHTQLHLHLYYSPLLTACLPSLSLSLPSLPTTCRTSPWLLWFLQQSRGTCSKFFFAFSFFIVFNDFSAIFRRRCWKFPFTVCHIFLYSKFCDFNFILICT